MISNCPFKYRCDKTWDDLAPTDNVDVKFCQYCTKKVFLVTSDDELNHAIKNDQCVAIQIRDDDRGEPLPMGYPAGHESEEEKNERREVLGKDFPFNW